MGLFKKILVFCIILAILCSFAMAKPKWAQSNTEPKPIPNLLETITPTQTKEPTTTTKNTSIASKTSDTSSSTSTKEETWRDWNWEAIGVILVIIGGFAGWFFGWRARNRTTAYMRKINIIINSYDNQPSESEAELIRIKEDLEHDFAKGKLNEQSYGLLDRKLDEGIKAIRKGVIGGRFDLTKNIKSELDDMLEDGAITKEEYDRFKKLDLKKISSKDEKKLKSLMKRWRNKDKVRLND